ncbi:thioredoxin domain-containing protein 12-like isoform X3 [Lycorma delicatula]|uniref:thioredoxin domain-containing protein 12-like isoform X3 n=1 Tax=Lycorma delicatula TaxID=130591 RepID=UPI003F517B3F
MAYAVKRTRLDVSAGFGREISWRFFEMGLAEAKSQNLPIMMIFHKSWCSACKALKPQVAASTEIRDLSKQFIMINVADDEEPHDAKYAPDGAYIPRILFLRPNGEIMYEFYNDIGHPSYKFFYSDSHSIVRTMKKVLNSYAASTKIFREL